MKTNKISFVKYAEPAAKWIEKHLRIRISARGLVMLTGFFLYCAVICFFCSCASPFMRRYMADDGEVFYYMGRAMRDGLTLYRDAFDHKGIYIFFINYLGACLDAILPGFGLYLIEVLFRTLECVVMYHTFRSLRMNTKLSVALALGFEALLLNYFTYIGGNFTETYAVTFQLISAALIIRYYFVDRTDDHPELYMLIHGICSGVCLMLRANMVAMWIPFGAVLFITLLMKKRWHSFFRNAAALLCGVAITLVPAVVYCLIRGCFEDMMFGSFGFNFLYSSSLRTAFKYLGQIITYNAAVVLWLALAGVIVAVLSKRVPLAVKIIMPCSFALSYVLLFMSGRVLGFGHYFHYFIPFCIPLFVAIGWLAQEKLPRLTKRLCDALDRPAIFAGCIALCILATVCINMKTPIKLFADSQSRELAQQVSAVADVLEGEEDEYLLCVGHCNSFYNATDMYAPTPYFHRPSISYSVFPDAIDAQANAIFSGAQRYVLLPKWSYMKESHASGAPYVWGVEELDIAAMQCLQTDYDVIYTCETPNLTLTLYEWKY
ncbi:MAG: hypothetical protein IJC18_01510 [Clostridia bacterium]|nr:hypothetical protein [Clostridia bacterium]